MSQRHWKASIPPDGNRATICDRWPECGCAEDNCYDESDLTVHELVAGVILAGVMTLIGVLGAVLLFLGLR